MPGNPGAWGIDIGQAGLKAIRLEIGDATEQVVATAFDYIAHPKILSQPDAIPEELISQALAKFLKQNDIKNDVLAISVPGQSALARFIQLPPVEASKVSEIVKYEARQQIPFALEDVVWDYQTLGKGTEESGFLLEAEVGLFAMKRDQVMNQLKPFTNAGIEVELIQIAPLSLYNFLSFDQLGIRMGDEVVGMDSYTILLDMGADNTTLLVSNGQKIWIRNVPVGGNHFTRALTKEMKLTFAKAEHLKCNATKSPDPRAVFQALRPVFNDYVSEIQRSIGYFSSVNREAKIAKVVGLGNGFKLAGLQKFLQQNLQYDVERIDSFSAITPDAFKDAALFEENILSFPVCYGTALQALKQTRIRTSLLPKEITTARSIARKRPWAVAAAACLLAGLATSAFAYAHVYRSVSEDRFHDAEEAVKVFKKTVGEKRGAYGSATSQCKAKKAEGDSLVSSLNGRSDWLQLYKAIDACLPHDATEIQDIRKQNRVHIIAIEPRWQPKLQDWFDHLSPTAKESLSEEDKQKPLGGGGLVVTLVGEHYHDDTMGKGIDGLMHAGVPPAELDKYINGFGDGYLKDHFLKNLQQWAAPPVDGSEEVLVGGIGISHAVIAVCPSPRLITMDPLHPSASGSTEWLSGLGSSPWGGGRGGHGGGGGGRRGGVGGMGRLGAGGNSGQELRERIRPVAQAKKVQTQQQMYHTTFVVQFVWNPGQTLSKPPSATKPAAVVTATATAAAVSKSTAAPTPTKK
jgi:type IV pilus assembly protein PilM